MALKPDRQDHASACIERFWKPCVREKQPHGAGGGFLPLLVRGGDCSAAARRTHASFAGQTPERRASSCLVRIDEEFLARGALGINRDVGEIERLLQRYDSGVVA